MQTSRIEATTARWLSIAAALVTLLVTSSISFDPVNVSKLVAIAGFGTAIGVISLLYSRKVLLSDTKAALIAAIAFLAFSISGMIFSDSPLLQNFYGSFGRNTGFLAYFGLLGIFLGALTFRSRISFESILKALFVAGIINILYCALVISGTDLIGWNNIYNKILGTFGNPNFISAFLGMYITMSLAYILESGHKIWVRLLTFLFCALAFFEILKSDAIQGIVVTFAGIAIVLFFKIRSLSKNNIFTASYSLVVIIVGGFALAGALQKGPLASLIYKRSVSLRGFYWDAGIQMGLLKPFTGVGLDSYGDWYRQERSVTVLKEQSPDTITNAAHNVVIDIFASGGFPLLISYLAILVIAGIAIVKVTLRARKYDGIFAALATGWICYQLQSIISINQIGLAVWGWVLSGAVIAYEISTRESEQREANSTGRSSGKKKVETSAEVFAAGSIAGIVGVLIAIPPFAADANWRTAVKSAGVDNVYSAALKWPQDSYRYSTIALQLEQNKFYDKAIAMARIAVKYNPRSYDAWSYLANFTNATSEERALGKKMMIELDPNNPTIK